MPSPVRRCLFGRYSPGETKGRWGCRASQRPAAAVPSPALCRREPSSRAAAVLSLSPFSRRAPSKHKSHGRWRTPKWRGKCQTDIGSCPCLGTGGSPTPSRVPPPPITLPSERVLAVGATPGIKLVFGFLNMFALTKFVIRY